MSGGIIGGDEVGALVLDMGSYTTRAGYSGEDLPKCDFPSYVGIIEEFVDKTDAMDVDTRVNEPTSNKRYVFDSTSIKAATKNKVLQPFLKNGLIDDFDIFEKVFEYSFRKSLRCDPSTHPVLMSEPFNNPKAKREKLCEIMFEKFDVPGFYLAKNAVLSAFACNRTSGVVLDCGATHTTAVPIHDGMVLNKAVAQSPLCGDFVLAQCKAYLEEQAQIELVPYYQVKSKEAVESGEPAKFTRRTNVNDLTESYKKFMLKETLLDFATNVLQVSDSQYNENDIGLLPRVTYEFPNGYNTDFGEERFRIPEVLFDPTLVKGVQPNTMFDTVHLVTGSIGMCDPELRLGFFSNIMVVGGNSLLTGFIERLTNEFNNLSYKTKLYPPPTTAERRFSSWIGGSILGSLGTFHQMWISKQEYEENGKCIVDKKCHA